MVQFQKMAKIGQQKRYHLGIIHLAPLKPLKLNTLLTSGIKKGFKMVPFQKRPKFRQQKWYHFKKKPKVPQQKWYHFRKGLNFANKNGTIFENFIKPP